ncbi:tetratricopeptide repeat protein [uncultured Microscilla sp.]|uniref:tetratricopeptide repeat protein n=1 Tax=uncultured Microscilla sp. TaxID=432653 RepID=UPI0026167678|nr:tetratricopeptide repeat protein [uncultured Microscilla sp.]
MPLKTKITFLFLFSFLLVLPLQAQKKAIDSLFNLLNDKKVDTFQVNLLVKLSGAYTYVNPEEARKYAAQALEMAKKIKYSKGIANAYSSTGVVHSEQGNPGEAIKNYLQGLKIAESINNQRIVAKISLNMGNVYSRLGDIMKAKEYAQRALAIYQKLEDQNRIATSYNNLGAIYQSMGNIDSAVLVYKTAQKVFEKNNNQYGVASALANLGIIYESIGDISEALKYQEAVVEIEQKMGNKNGVAFSSISIGNTYLKVKKYAKAKAYFNKALVLSRDIGSFELLRDSYLSLYSYYRTQEDFEQALDYYQLYVNYKDSIFNKNKSEQIARMQTLYETDKGKKDLEIEKTKNQAQKEELRRRGIQNIALIVGILLIVGVVLYLYRNNLRKQKTNKILEEQKRLIEDKNVRITDSINYARRIQSAVLPLHEEISKSIPEYFILWKPRDIVSGDFYWFAKTQPKPIYEEKMTFDGVHRVFKGVKGEKIILAAVDCTGHGVPGAFMSMIGSRLLNEIVNEQGVTEADEILNLLHDKVRVALKQDETQTHDGMDMSLVVIDKDKQIMQFAGAKNPLYMVQVPRIAGEKWHDSSSGKPEDSGLALQTVKGDIMSIGGFQIFDEIKFKKTIINISPKKFESTTFYMFSDGFQDQFGGIKGKKFMVKRFRKLLFEINNKPIDRQKQLLEETLNDWMDGHAQVDDILVMGIRL